MSGGGYSLTESVFYQQQAIAAFFSHNGVWIALAVASKITIFTLTLGRLGGCLWDSKGWHWHIDNGSAETWCHHEVHRTHRHGWYPRYIWSDYSCDLDPEEYLLLSLPSPLSSCWILWLHWQWTDFLWASTRLLAPSLWQLLRLLSYGNQSYFCFDLGQLLTSDFLFRLLDSPLAWWETQESEPTQ